MYIIGLQKIPSPQTTAQSILDNFVRFIPAPRLLHGYIVSKRALPLIYEYTVIVLDGSGSIGRCEFGEGKKAMTKMMTLCEASKQYICFNAGVTYSSSAKVSFNFLRSYQASRKMSAISYPGSTTNTAAGLEEAEKLLKSLYRNF